ncbi:MAG: penicillin acylase family protein, partial [Candidatus Poribacteria bacterium]|nr:penicillin acylase family protein [Candidatus Poribacteria bacterium]
PARIFTENLIQVGSSDGDVAQAQSLLRNWDYSMDRSLVQPSIYAQTKSEVTRQITQELLGNQADLVLSGEAGSYAHLRLIELEILLAIKNDDNSLLPTGKSWLEVLLFALQRAVTNLKARLGDDMSQWCWERLHYTCPQHPLSAIFPELAEKLDPPSNPIHGDGDTPLAGSYSFNNQFIATGMSVNRYIHDPADWTNSLWIVPLGASGHPGSPHYADQAQTWADVEYIPQLWDWNQIVLESESRQQLIPCK